MTSITGFFYVMSTLSAALAGIAIPASAAEKETE
jgi:hypothetical protein